MRSFKFYGIWPQTDIHTTSANAVTLVWGSLRLAPKPCTSLVVLSLDQFFCTCPAALLKNRLCTRHFPSENFVTKAFQFLKHKYVWKMYNFFFCDFPVGCCILNENLP